jgi:uncharacterized protein YjiS (DUF1127 family)
MSNRLHFYEPLRLPMAAALPRNHPSLWDQLRAAWRRHHSRQQIAELNSYLLKDIGITHADAEFEANKPFWRD